MDGFLLDTNVLSEIYDAEHRDEKVDHWVRRQAFTSLFVSTLNIAEIQYGIENLPVGMKRNDLQRVLYDFILPQFEGRILDFDLKAAQAWGTIKAADRKNGRPRPIMDGLLASIAVANDLGIATRNTKDFVGLDIETVNPWL